MDSAVPGEDDDSESNEGFLKEKSEIFYQSNDIGHSHLEQFSVDGNWREANIEGNGKYAGNLFFNSDIG